MSVFAVILVGIFVIASAAILIGVAVLVVARMRDHRTKEERRADEYGDMDPGSMKLTPGYGANQIGGMWH